MLKEISCKNLSTLIPLRVCLMFSGCLLANKNRLERNSLEVFRKNDYDVMPLRNYECNSDFNLIVVNILELSQ